MTGAFFTREEKLFTRVVQQFPPKRPLVSIKGVLFATAWAIPVLMLLGMRGA